MILHTFFIYLSIWGLFSLHHHEVSGLNALDTADWSYFEGVNEIDGQHSASLIRSLATHQYWDVLKGVYRTGMLGESLLPAHPELVSRLEKKLTVGAGSKDHKVDSLVVDTSTVFAFGLAALKNLCFYASELSINLIAYEKRKHDKTSDKHHKIRNLMSKEDLAVEMEILQLRLATLTQLVQSKHEKLSLKYANLDFRANGSHINHLELHETLQRDKRQQQVVSQQLAAERVRLLLTAYQETEDSVVASERDILQKEFAAEVKLLESDGDVIVAAAAFRVSEQLAAARQNEQVELRILAARSEALRGSTTQIVDVVFRELAAQCAGLLQDPWTLLSYSRYLLLAVALTAIALELSQLLKRLLRRAFSGSADSSFTILSRARSTQLNIRASRDDVKDSSLLERHQIVASADSRAAILACVDSLAVAVARGGALPNILLCGAAGCGKTVLARAICAESALRVTFLNAGDLQALGSQGGLFLNKLFAQGAVAGSGRRQLIVVENADPFIASRQHRQQPHSEDDDPAQQQTTNCNTNSCLYALLNGIRESCPGHAVLLTTRLDVTAVDSAILDR